MTHQAFCIKAVLFDFDGTLTQPESLDFSVIRQALGCPSDIPVLEFIETLPSPDQKKQATEKLEQFEFDAARRSEPNPGAESLIRHLRSKGLPVGIITRNTFQCIELALENFEMISPDDFELIISRDDPVSPKPSPDGIFLAAQKLNADTNEILVVGDFIFDIQAGERAGAITVLLDNGITKSTGGQAFPESDFTIFHLEEIEEIVRLGSPLPAGKFPNDLLKGVLDQFGFDDPSVLIHPGIGEDTAAVDVNGEEVLVLKSDPITFATDAIGHYAVLVNANDIATSGAKPRWFLTTLLFPCGTTASQIRHVIHDLKTICQLWGITLCGGHTEITDAVVRPVITGMLAGTVAKNALIDKRNMKPGDKILLTKGISVEGTSIIAREFGDQLERMGMDAADIETCRDFLSQISILKEAEIARHSPGISAMHDVTEGGLATALEELSIAGGYKIRVNMDDIPVFPETAKICELFRIDPLGLIGSGSLLISCRKDTCETLMADIRAEGIQVSCIAEVLDAAQGIEAMKQGNPAEWPRFEVDEIARLF
ncbi:MAG: hypothetical protein B6245_24325 [Desulfobacteraceae bacterium 4572_88]|nr:MAG: hypothetical protein B6245_24325 [Desulfobacteraceae bacterium 4572_88]